MQMQNFVDLQPPGSGDLSLKEKNRRARRRFCKKQQVQTADYFVEQGSREHKIMWGWCVAGKGV